jgi:hypothetical protein
VLYELATGQVPFDASTPLALLMKHVYEPLPAPRKLNPDLPAPVEAVLLRALEKDPDARYQSAREMAQDIQRALRQVERALVLSQLMSEGIAPPRARSSYTTDKLVLPTEPVPPATSHRPVQQPLISQLPVVIPQRSMVTRLAAVVLLVALAGALAAIVGVSALSSLAARTLAPTAGPATPAATLAAVVDLPPIAPPTPVPTATSEPSGPALEPPTPSPEPAREPPSPEPLVPTAIPIPPTPVPTPIVVTAEQSDGQITFLFDDEVWQGSYHRPSGGTYGGRTATWIYGTSTSYSTMRAVFDVPAQAYGTISFNVEGMDSEDRVKTMISIQLNGTEIYRGPNPLPDDDHPLETGTWATYSWSFDAALLQLGRNEISVTNLETGAFGLPPFFMLDYATITYSEQ